MNTVISKYNFLSPSSRKPRKLLKINYDLLNSYFSEVDIEFDSLHISADLYELFQLRYYGKHEEFLIKIGAGADNLIIPKLDYKLKESQFENVIAVSLYYHIWLYDLWSHDYNQKITKEIITAQKDFSQIINKLPKLVKDLNGNHASKISIRVNGNKLNINSYTFTSSILHFLKRWVDPQKYKELVENDRKIKRGLELIEIDVSRYGAVGVGQKYEADLTQKFTAHLFKFLKGENVILPKGKTKELSDRKYYSCIADLYSLLTLPKTATTWEWDYLDMDYEQEIQIKKIESWNIKYNKKVNKKPLS